MDTRRVENPFVFGEIIEEENFVDRKDEIKQLIRDLADGQKVFLLSPRRFGKSSLVTMCLLKLRKQHIRTVFITVSSYASYTQFLEKLAEKVLRAAGPWDQVKNWVVRFFRQVKAELNVNPMTGEIGFSLGRGSEFDPTPVAPEIFALPGELSENGGFRMAICLDEFQQIFGFDRGTVENVLRNEVQRQRQVGYVFAGSQPSLMEDLLSPKRPFHKAGPKMFLDKIPAEDWQEFIVGQFERRGRNLAKEALDRLLEAADLIPYDVQRLAHELWDDAELEGKRALAIEDVDRIVDRLVAGQSAFYEQQWERLPARQKAALQALAKRGSNEVFSQAVRHEYRLGAASTVQKALQSLDGQDILDRYHGRYFFVDPLLALWIVKVTQ